MASKATRKLVTPSFRTPSRFAKLLAAMIRERGVLKQQFAREVGITPTMLSQYLADCYAEPSIDFCFRLSKYCDVMPSKVLRAAGRGDLADWLDRIYSSNEQEISARERELLANWRALDTDRQRAVELLAAATRLEIASQLP